MQLTKSTLVSTADSALRDSEEVAVACAVGAAEREGADEIDADEVRIQNRLDTADEVRQEIVQLDERRRG